MKERVAYLVRDGKTNQVLFMTYQKDIAVRKAKALDSYIPDRNHYVIECEYDKDTEGIWFNTGE